MQSKHTIRAIINKLEYKPRTGFRLVEKQGLMFINHWQLISDACSSNRTLEIRHGRKFYISIHMTDQEVMRTCALAVKQFEEHEANEWLKYKGQKVLDPHPEGERS